MFPTTRKVIIASTALAAAVWLAAPLSAQRSEGPADRGHSQRGAQSAGRTQASSAPAQRQAQAPPQSRGPAAGQAPRQTSQGSAPQVQGPPQSRGFQGGSNGGARTQAGPRQVPQQQQYNANRSGTQSYSNHGYYQQAPHGYVQSYAVPYRSYGYHNYGYAYGHPYNTYHYPVFVQPYYAFRPHFSIGFGLSVGYGVAYPFQYYSPYAPYNYGVTVAPGYTTSSYYNRVGGVSFNLDPQNAAVFVDGSYVGTADEFGSDQMPLTLSVGRHHIDLRADGFMTASFELSVLGGQVIPYSGTLALN